MAETNNNPVSGTVETPTAAPTQEQILGDMAELLDDSPQENTVQGHEEQAAAPDQEDDPLGLEVEADDVEETDSDEEPDGQQEVKGGRFAPDSAKVRLDENTVITVAELKKTGLLQRDYTRKRQEDVKAFEAFEAERKEYSQYAQSLNQTRDYLAWYAETYLPKQPEPFKGAPDDYVGFIEWQKKDAEWQTHARAYQSFLALKEQDEQRKNGETAAEMRKRLETERTKLLDAIPVLKDQTKGKVVWDNIVSGAQKHYGITAQEVNSVSDHRMLKALRDALAYQQLRAKAPEVKADAVKRPVTPGRRQQPQAAFKKAADGRLEQLKRKPTLENGVASLMDFDL